MMTARELISSGKLKGVKKQGKNWVALCPAHDDQKQSLSITEGDGDKVLTHCHAGCTPDQVWAALNISNGKPSTQRREIAHYDYRNAAGEVVYQSVRFDPKDFRQRRPDGNGEYTWNLNGTPRVPYRLMELLAADPAKVVFICEGEKDCDALAVLGLISTTNCGGAGKWKAEWYNKYLEGRSVVILPDNDEPGRKHVQQVAASLAGTAKSIKVIELPDLPDKGDVSDWLSAGGTVADLRRIVTGTKEYQAGETAKPSYMVHKAADLLNLEFSPLRWAIMSLLAEGLFILAGRPKLGKSWLVLNFAIAIASGGYALGTIKVEAGDVLYCALEDGARRLQQRLRKSLGPIGPVPENLELATEWRPFDRGGLEDLESWLKAHPSARLVVFDTLERVRPSEDPKARLYHSDYEAVKGLADLAKRYGVCFLVVHHVRKQEASDHLDLVSGSTGLTGAADGILILKRSRGEMDATLTANGRDFPDTELALKFDGELCDWRAMGDAAEYRMSQERRDVLELLRRSDALKPKEISVELHKDYGAIKKLLFDMRKGGLLHSDSKGRYSIIESGKPATVTNLFSRKEHSESIYYPPGATDQEIEEIYERATR